MEEERREPAAPRAVRVCRVCVGLIESPAAVEPCGHVFCRACIQPQAAPAAAGTCPVCREPIGAIRLLQGQDSRAGVAPRRRHRRRVHPFVVRWRQRQEQERQEQEQQEQAAPEARRRRRLCDGDRAPSPVARQRARREWQQLGGNGPWVPRTSDELLSSGDHRHHPARVPI